MLILNCFVKLTACFTALKVIVNEGNVDLSKLVPEIESCEVKSQKAAAPLPPPCKAPMPPTPDYLKDTPYHEDDYDEYTVDNDENDQEMMMPGLGQGQKIRYNYKDQSPYRSKLYDEDKKVNPISPGLPGLVSPAPKPPQGPPPGHSKR